MWRGGQETVGRGKAGHSPGMVRSNAARSNVTQILTGLEMARLDIQRTEAIYTERDDHRRAMRADDIGQRNRAQADIECIQPTSMLVNVR